MNAAGPPPPLAPTPLVNLPAPPPLADEPPPLPDEVLLDSRGELARRLLRQVWRPALVIAPLWLLLVVGYVHSTSPTFWLLSPLFLGSDMSLGEGLRILSLSPWGTGAALVLVPVVGTALSVALVPVAAALAAPLSPRRFLTETAFRNALRSVLARVLIAPAAITIALLLVAVVCQAPLAWKDLSYGVLAGFAGGIVLTWWATLLVRRVIDVDALLGTAEEPERAPVAADRRHLPPTGSVPVPGVIGRGLAVTLLGLAPWIASLVMPLAWLVFGIGDAVTLFTRVFELYPSTGPALAPVTYAVGALVLALVLAGMALAPLVAMRIAEPLRGRVVDLRTYPTWGQRAAVNPWEVRVCQLIALLDTVIAWAGIALLAAGLGAVGALGAMAWTWIVLSVVLVPAVLLPVMLRVTHRSLRTIVYGPAGRYARRAVAAARVAPSTGTRADLVEHPAARARIRQSGAAPAPAPSGRPAVARPPQALPDFAAERRGSRAVRPARRHDGGAIPHDLEDLAERGR